MPSLKDFIFGTGDKTQQLTTKTPQQNSFIKDLINQLDPSLLADMQNDPTFAAGSDFLQGLLNGDTSALEQPIRNDFYQNVLPSIYAQYGGANSLSSSDFMNAQAGAAGNFENNLAATRWGAQLQGAGLAGQYGQIGSQNRLGAWGLAQQPTFGYQHQQASPGYLNYAASGFSQGVGQMAGQGFGNYFKPKTPGV